MEKDLYNDRLEDYVKKSFEDYEEIPPGDMWNRIEEVLPTQEPVRRPLVFLYQYKWQIAAASVIMLLACRLLLVQSYYEQQLRSIAAQNQTVSSNKQSSSAALSVTDVSEVRETPSNNTISTENSGDSSIRSSASSVQKISTANNVSQIPGMVPDNSVGGLAINQVSLPQEDGKTVQQVFNRQVSDVTEFSLLPAAVPAMLKTSNPVSIPSAATPTIKPVGGGRKWYVLAGIAPGRIKERQRPSHPGGHGPVFASRSEMPETTTSFSLRLGRALNRKIAVESGISYQEMKRETTHKPRFEFREGQMIPTGGTHHQQARSFQYDLNTYGGSASVTLRADVVGSNIPDENERIEAVIRSNENVQVLQVPLTVAGRIGEGRMLGVVRAGIVGNYMISNNFEVTAYQLDNPELQLQDNNAYTVEFHSPRRFFPGYQIALGAEYRVSGKLSVSAFPVITGDFPRKDNFRGGNLPGQSTLAFTAAASYWF